MKKTLCSLLVMTAFSSQAAISLGQTRVIYNGDAKAASVEVKNNVDAPYMVQTWLDAGDKNSVPKNIPMLVTPPIMKLDGNKSAVLRVIYSGSGLPQDVETVYWINVQEIPGVSHDQNALQLAQRIRIKLFYRPQGLGITLPEAAEKLQWQCKGNHVHVTNSTALHVSLTSISVNGRSSDADMVNPHASADFTLPQVANGLISFSYINDYGGYGTLEAHCE